MHTLSKALIAGLALSVLGGCVATQPAPVAERVVPPAVKPQPRVVIDKPATGMQVPVAKPDAAAVVKPLAAADASIYTVKQGDTLFGIAKSHGVAVRNLAAWNNLEDASSIRRGQQLRLTAPEGVAAAPQTSPAVTPDAPAPVAVEARPLMSSPQPGDAPVKTQPQGVRVPYSDQAYAQMSKAAAPAKPDAIEVKPEVKPETARADGEVDWSWPAQGKVITNFNDSSSKGIVISGKRGQPVTASAGGRVIFSGTGIRGLGKLVVIRHNSNYLSVYGHNDNLLVKEGQTVGKGQRIAEMGSSDADQVKLHFEIRRQGKPIDPIQLLPGI